jgi:SAM-dependent methyltransferase
VAARDLLLGTRSGYTVFRRLIKADRGMRMIVDDHIRAAEGQTLIDLGCGTGDLVKMLPGSVSYIGIDHNPSYLSPEALGEDGGTGPRFVNADLGDLGAVTLPQADVSVALGVLHHLTDEQVVNLLRSVAAVTRPGGRFVSVDPVFHPDQRSVARIAMSMDRGRFVRQREHYEFLTRSVFADVRAVVRSDINPFPYTHLVLEVAIDL